MCQNCKPLSAFNPCEEAHVATLECGCGESHGLKVCWPVARWLNSLPEEQRQRVLEQVRANNQGRA